MSIFELVTGDSITANDPGFPEHAATAPDQFGPSTDPSRFTIWIPTEHVTVNMGNPVFTGTGSTENTAGVVQVDPGFVAQTDHHIHLHTFGQAKATPAAAGRTLLRLGTPVQVVKAGSTYASTGIGSHTDSSGAPLPLLGTSGNLESTDIGSRYPGPYNAWYGYALITEGGAYQESQENHLIVSGKADLRLGADRTVLVGSPGQVQITADTGNDLPGIIGNLGPDSVIDGPGKWVGHHPADFAIDAAANLLGAGLALFAVCDLAFNYRFARSPYAKSKTDKAPAQAKVGWAGTNFGDWAGAALQLIGAGGSVYAAYRDLNPSTKPGDVSIYASDSFGANGAVSVSIHGGVMTSVTGGALNLISADAIMSISSLLISSLAGTVTAVSGLYSVAVTSQWGSAKMNGRQSAEVSSAGTVYVAAKEQVQVNATDGDLYVHGRTGFYLGCGGGEAPPDAGPYSDSVYADGRGYGMMATPDNKGTPGQLLIGRLAKANDFKQRAPDTADADQIFIKMSDSQMVLKHKSATLTFQNNQISVGNGRESKILIG
jgi:hypothetical protein